MQELEDARIIIDRIRTRKLYRCVDYKVIDWPMIQTFKAEVTPKHIMQAVLQRQSTTDSPRLERSESSSTVSSLDDDPLEERDIEVDVAVMHYGMQDSNPVDKVKFYSKRCPKRKYYSFGVKSDSR